jgi:hypothetical protein
MSFADLLGSDVGKHDNHLDIMLAVCALCEQKKVITAQAEGEYGKSIVFSLPGGALPYPDEDWYAYAVERRPASS